VGQGVVDNNFPENLAKKNQFWNDNERGLSLTYDKDNKSLEFHTLSEST
jgi:hypothetical protein